MANLYWNSLPVTNFDEISAMFRVIDKPRADLVFWAVQINFRQVDGTSRGGAHFGLQTSQGLSNATKTAINWGGYDDVLPKLGDNSSPTFRGSRPTIPNAGSDSASPLFAWHPDVDYLFRVFRSPKQNWTDAELTDETGNVGGDQQPGEVAWRCTITDVATGVETWIRDILVPNCHTTAGMMNPIMWDEDFNNTTPPTATVAWDIRWSQCRVDKQLVTKMQANVNTDPFTNQDFVVDAVGWRDKRVVTRTVTEGQILDLPALAVRASSVASLGSATAGTVLTIPKPPSTVAGDLLLAFVANDSGGASPTPPTGWTLLSAKVGADAARLSVYYYRSAGEASYDFTTGGATNYFSGAILAIYKADPLVVPTFGTAGISGSGVSVWVAPSMSKNTNYGLVLAAVAAGPQFTTGGSVTFPGGLVEVADTSSVSPKDSYVGVAYEPTPTPNGVTGERTGSTGVNTWRNVAQHIVVPVVQRVLPASDVANSGWTTAPLFSKVNEATPSDAEFISGPNGAVCTIALGTLTDPGLDVGFVVRYRVRRQDAASASLLVELMQGATVVASKTETITGTLFAAGTLAVTEAQAATITNFADLRLRLTATTA